MENDKKKGGDRIISKVKPADLENYQAMRQKTGLADATIDHEIGKAKTMIFKAFENDIIGGGMQAGRHRLWPEIKGRFRVSRPETHLQYKHAEG